MLLSRVTPLIRQLASAEAVGYQPSSTRVTSSYAAYDIETRVSDLPPSVFPLNLSYNLRLNHRHFSQSRGFSTSPSLYHTPPEDNEHPGRTPGSNNHKTTSDQPWNFKKGVIRTLVAISGLGLSYYGWTSYNAGRDQDNSTKKTVFGKIEEDKRTQTTHSGDIIDDNRIQKTDSGDIIDDRRKQTTQSGDIIEKQIILPEKKKR